MPLPSLFLIHEQRVHGFWPFVNEPHVPATISPQDWILVNEHASQSGASDTQGSLSNAPDAAHNERSPAAGSSSREPGPGTTTLSLDTDVVMEILSATRKSASWKHCVQEGTSWVGITNENIAKYKELVDLWCLLWLMMAPMLEPPLPKAVSSTLNL